MEPITCLEIRRLEIAGLQCYREPVELHVGFETIITGHNRVGKSTIREALAFLLTGSTFFGESRLDRLYSSGARNLRIAADFVDQDGAEHRLIRERREDVTTISLDGSTVTKSLLAARLADRDLLLSLLNPHYFTEKLRPSEARALLEQNLPPVEQSRVLDRLTDPERALLEGLPLEQPEAAGKRLLEEIRELEETVIACEGEKSLLCRQQQERDDRLGQIEHLLAELEQETRGLELEAWEGLDLDALRKEAERTSAGEDLPPLDFHQFDTAMGAAQIRLGELRAKSCESPAESLAEPAQRLALLQAEYQRITNLLSGATPEAPCPECGNPIPQERFMEFVNSHVAQLKAIKTRTDRLTEEIARLTAQEQAVRENFIKSNRLEQRKCHDYLNRWQTERQRHIDRWAEQVRRSAVRGEELKALLAVGNLTAAQKERLAQINIQRDALAAEPQLLLRRDFQKEFEEVDRRMEALADSIQEKRERQAALLSFLARRCELAFSGLRMPNVRIVLYEVVKSTGELKPVFRLSYQGRPYVSLSLSEKLLAGLEIVELLKRISHRQYPVFIDDCESVAQLPRPSGQVFLSQFVRGEPLRVNGVEVQGARPAGPEPYTGATGCGLEEIEDDQLPLAG